MTTSASLGTPRGARRLWTTALIVLGVLLLIAAGLGVAYPVWWNHNSSTKGKQLVHGFGPPPTGLPTQPAATCINPPQKAKAQTASGLVEIPTLSLTAPVLQGLSDGVLAVAAGHDIDSPWPGGRGESILESHDVSYFSQISKLKSGDQVVWVDHCAQLTFVVIGHKILSPGALIDAPAGDRGLALITCYPTNALFYTPDRFVVLTSLVAKGTASKPPGPVKVVTSQLKVPAPPDLVAQNLTLGDSSVLVGYMNVTGTPSSGWTQGPASLDLEALALESYIGAEKAVAQHNSTWWRDLAVPRLNMPTSLWSNGDDTNVTEEISGNTVVSVTLSSANETFVLVPSHGDLLINGITVP
jgi:LPXTG-site transpeptidase (sortase) family protein